MNTENINEDLSRVSKRKLIAQLVREHGVIEVANFTTILAMHKPEQFDEAIRQLKRNQPGWFYARKRK